MVDFGINKLKHLKNSSNSSSYRFFILSDNAQVGSTFKNYDDFIQTAILLGMMSGIGDSKDFSKLTYENFEEHRSKLPMEFQKKAKNYFHQQELLIQCIKAWERNDLNLFGKLIKKSKNENSREIDILCEKINGLSSIYGAKVSNNLQIVGICENKNAEEAIKNLISKQEEVDCRFCSISNGILYY